MSAPEEQWISVSDLMGGFVAVVVVMFVLASAIGAERALEVLRSEERRREDAARNQSEARARTATVSRAELRRRDITGLLDQLKRDVEREGQGEDFKIDVPTRTIRLQDQTFPSASACVRGHAQATLVRWSPWILAVLRRYDDVTLDVEGHTDDREMVLRRGDALELRDQNCALFDDNLTLSAARAREARRAIVGSRHDPRQWPREYMQRVAVVGYGGSRPLPGSAPSDGVNRRIEIHIRVRDESRDGESERSPAEPR